MQLFHRRGDGRRPPRLATGAALASLCLVAGGCVTYRAAPLDPALMLAGLDEVRWHAAAGDADAPAARRPEPGQLASFAVQHHPSLRAARAELGVARALLVEAELLPDPSFSWDGMDALASELVGNSATSVDFLSGFGLALPLARPGERDAKQESARWRTEEARCALAEAEWKLATQVYIAAEEVVVATILLAQNSGLTAVARETRDYFERALKAGTATAIEANLAQGDLLAVQARELRIESRLRTARQELAALLGLPPETVIEVAHPHELEHLPKLPSGPGELSALALELRPDMARILARYEAAEQDVRLEVARQWPELTIGTGLAVVPGLFSRFNRPAIETAVARRTAVGLEVVAATHRIRGEVHARWAALEEAERELTLLMETIVPNAERSLELVGRAFSVGEVTLLEILNVQRAVVDARTRRAEAEALRDKCLWELLAAGGLLLSRDVNATNRSFDSEEEAR